MADIAPALPRVYFDGNEATEANFYGLWLDKSRDDLAKIPGGPKEGMTITIYMIEEIEMEAILEWNENWNGWTARPIEGTVRENHDKWD